MKNTAFDKAENPYKLDFQAIEPEPSTHSAFSIEPRQCQVGARSTATFTVTFDPTNGPHGKYRSIVMASPELSAEELEIARGPQSSNPALEVSNSTANVDLSKKGALGIISLNLEAFTI